MLVHLVHARTICAPWCVLCVFACSRAARSFYLSLLTPLREKGCVVQLCVFSSTRALLDGHTCSVTELSQRDEGPFVLVLSISSNFLLDESIAMLSITC